MNLNQLSVIGFVRKNAETKSLPNGTPVAKFSIATKRSWKDENGTRQQKTQWHNVVAFGKSFAQMTDRLVKGAHVFVQGELTTREYDRTIKVPVAQGKTIEHTTPQLIVKLKADTIRILDRSTATGEQRATPPSRQSTRSPTEGPLPLAVSRRYTGPLDKMWTIVLIELASLRSAKSNSHAKKGLQNLDSPVRSWAAPPDLFLQLLTGKAHV
ncbi:MAG: single-stranded DNA-binding protein [Bryobacteraceae bacterium]